MAHPGTPEGKPGGQCSWRLNEAHDPLEMSTTYPQLLRVAVTDPSDNLNEPYDRQLVEQSKAGDADAFARLYHRYADRVFRYMCFQVGDEQAAEDLAARVYLKAWRNMPCYEAGNPPFSAWLYMIARQAVIDYQQSRNGESSIKEITSPEDKGLAIYEPPQLCDNE